MLKHLLDVKGLTTGYDELVIVKDASITIDTNELVVLLGGNGAGKTTLIESIIGFNDIKQGEIVF